MSAEDVIAQLRDSSGALRVADLDAFAAMMQEAKEHEVVAETPDFLITDGVLHDGTRFYAIQGTISGSVFLIRQHPPAFGAEA